MKTKNFDEFLNEDIDTTSIPGLDDEPTDSDFRRSFLGQELEEDDDNEMAAYGYDQILDIITSNSPEEAAKIISNHIADIDINGYVIPEYKK